MKLPNQVIDPQTGVSVFERKQAHDAISTTNTEAREKILNEKNLKIRRNGFRL